MTLRGLARLFGVYALVLAAASVLLVLVLSASHHGPTQRSIASVWAQGVRRARAVLKPDSEGHVELEGVLTKPLHEWRGVLTAEDVIDSSPVLSTEPLIFGASFVPGRDGIELTYGKRVVYATVDDLLALKAYDHPLVIGPIRLQLGVDPDAVLDWFARELDVPRESIVEQGVFRRLVMHHRDPPEPAPELTRAALRSSVLAAGGYLARAVQPDGSYRYETNAIDGHDSEGYNWPRHAGATWFLAESALYSRDPSMLAALARAAHRLAEGALVSCGKHRCVAEGDRADLGSSALGLLALSEIVNGGLMPELRPAVRELAAFIRSQQRPDGEFMHFYDRVKNEPIDEQVLYYTGEASFALGRAARVTHDPRDVEAASRALDHLVTYPSWYVGWHYYYNAEHWTCHALEELWQRAPNKKALRFCLDWMAAVKKTAIWNREASPEYDGATSAGPLVPPAVVGTSTRMEAAVATLNTARMAGVSPKELASLEEAIDYGLRFLMHFQLNPGPSHLMWSPGTMLGGFPSTPTDLTVRIDFPQHAGTGLLAYLRDLERDAKRP